MAHGITWAVSTMPYDENPTVEITDLGGDNTGDRVKFTLRNCELPIANALRRVMIAEVRWAVPYALFPASSGSLFPPPFLMPFFPLLRCTFHLLFDFVVSMRLWAPPTSHSCKLLPQITWSVLCCRVHRACIFTPFFCARFSPTLTRALRITGAHARNRLGGDGDQYDGFARRVHRTPSWHDPPHLRSVSSPHNPTSNTYTRA